MRPYVNSTDDEIVAEITELRSSRKAVHMGGIVSKIAGEGRMVEYTRSSLPGIDNELRELYAEARRRNLAIGGTGGAIAVEIG